jgi:hypothetical protein
VEGVTAAAAQDLCGLPGVCGRQVSATCGYIFSKCTRIQQQKTVTARMCRTAFKCFDNDVACQAYVDVKRVCAAAAVATAHDQLCACPEMFSLHTFVSKLLCLLCMLSCRPINDTVKPIDADGPYEVLDAETIGECSTAQQFTAAALLRCTSGVCVSDRGASRIASAKTAARSAMCQILCHTPLQHSLLRSKQPISDCSAEYALH